MLAAIDKSIQIEKKKFPCSSVEKNCLWTEIYYKTVR